MSYFQGFLVPVCADAKPEYLAMARTAAAVFKDHGGLGAVECWAEDVPDGKVTDMKRAVQAEAGEAIVFSWVWWPDRATADAAAPKIMADERMDFPKGSLPFNPQRMIYAGYETVADTGSTGKFGYVDGIVAPAPGDGRTAFTDYAEKLAAIFTRHGALRVVDGWGVDVPDGKVTDFKRAVAAEAGEAVIFGWVAWPDKATRDTAFAAAMGDGSMQALAPTIDMKRAIFGGFTPVLDTDHD
jgi:uncharacterized protein YbaA (DUF1428 family)